MSLLCRILGHKVYYQSGVQLGLRHTGRATATAVVA